MPSTFSGSMMSIIVIEFINRLHNLLHLGLEGGLECFEKKKERKESSELGASIGDRRISEKRLSVRRALMMPRKAQRSSLSSSTVLLSAAGGNALQHEERNRHEDI